MARDLVPSGVLTWQAPEGETSWDRVARMRRLKAELDEEIKRTQVSAIFDSRVAGVPAAQLASSWGVTVAMVYTLAPVKTS